MLRAITVAALLVGFSAGSLVAQERVQFGYFAGFTAETLNQTGLAAGLSATSWTAAAISARSIGRGTRVQALIWPIASRCRSLSSTGPSLRGISSRP